MSTPDDPTTTLRTTAGDLPLHEYHLRLAGHAWTIAHVGAILSRADEVHYLNELRERLPYGAVLWPAAIALAHDLVARGDALRGARLLELGAGTGLPGIVAASLGARVVQTDRLPLALSLCERNGARNGVADAIERRLADWTAWDDAARYDVIVGADVIYADAMHPHLRAIFARNLAPGGRLLLADPFRPLALRLLEGLEADGWSVVVSKWTVGEGSARRPIGVFELAPPEPA